MVKQALENASGEVPKSFKGRRRAQKNKALNILSRTRQTQTHTRRRHSQIYGFPGLFTPQYAQTEWRPCPIIRLGSKCWGITWDFCCRLPEAQHYRT